jgi:hypothetical protein
MRSCLTGLDRFRRDRLDLATAAPRSRRRYEPAPIGAASRGLSAVSERPRGLPDYRNGGLAVLVGWA